MRENAAASHNPGTADKNPGLSVSSTSGRTDLRLPSCSLILKDINAPLLCQGYKPGAGPWKALRQGRAFSGFAGLALRALVICRGRRGQTGGRGGHQPRSPAETSFEIKSAPSQRAARPPLTRRRPMDS